MNKLFEWMEREYEASDLSLAVFRVVYASLLLLLIAPIGTNLLGLPGSAFSPPPGLPRVFPALPGTGWVAGINAAIIVLGGLLLVGWRTRLVSLLLGVVIVLAFAAQYSTGKISHTILVGLTPLVMSLSGWGARLSIDAKRYAALPDDQRERLRLWSCRALALLALGIGLAFSTAGYIKANTGWLALDTSATLGHAFSNIHGSGRDPVLFEPFRRHMPAFGWEVMDWGVVVFEFGMLCAVPWRRVFRWVLVVAVSFHFGVLLLFEIWFLTPVPTYAGFVAWALLLPRRPDLPGFYTWWDRHARQLGGVLGVGIPLFAGLYWLTQRQNTIMLLPEGSLIYLLFGPPVLVAAGWVVYECCRFLAPEPDKPAPTLRPGDGATAKRAEVAPPVLLFDGVCGLCNAWVDFVMKRDRQGVFRFATLQGAYAAQHVAGLDPDLPPESLLLIDADGLHVRSSSALKTLGRLPGVWRVLAVLLWVPAPLRDGVYRVIARFRYKLFGKKDACRLPTPEERERFLM
jgi:predicted DCC family thiol-disulfide oxidoreductase YuxK